MLATNDWILRQAQDERINQERCGACRLPAPYVERQQDERTNRERCGALRLPAPYVERHGGFRNTEGTRDSVIHGGDSGLQSVSPAWSLVSYTLYMCPPTSTDFEL